MRSGGRTGLQRAMRSGRGRPTVFLMICRVVREAWVNGTREGDLHR